MVAVVEGICELYSWKLYKKPWIIVLCCFFVKMGDKQAEEKQQLGRRNRHKRKTGLFSERTRWKRVQGAIAVRFWLASRKERKKMVDRESHGLTLIGSVPEGWAHAAAKTSGGDSWKFGLLGPTCFGLNGGGTRLLPTSQAPGAATTASHLPFLKAMLHWFFFILSPLSPLDRLKII